MLKWFRNVQNDSPDVIDQFQLAFGLMIFGAWKLPFIIYPFRDISTAASLSRKPKKAAVDQLPPCKIRIRFLDTLGSVGFKCTTLAILHHKLLIACSK